FQKADDQRRRVAAQRRQAGRQHFADVRRVLDRFGGGRIEDRRAQRRLQAADELRRLVAAELADDRAAGGGGQPVQVLRVEANAQRHGEERDRAANHVGGQGRAV